MFILNLIFRIQNPNFISLGTPVKERLKTKEERSDFHWHSNISIHRVVKELRPVCSVEQMTTII